MKHRTVITMTAAAGLAISRPPIHAPEGRVVVLRDGSTVLIRPVRSADTSLLADGFARLSAASRQMRFLSVKKELSTADLRYFTDVDHHDHEALAALDQAAGHGVGIARYIRDAGDRQAAEIAVTIVDDWQGLGLGTELLAGLSDRARSEGIRRFTALADAGNVAVAALLRNAGARLVRRGPGTVEYEITLASERQCALSPSPAWSSCPVDAEDRPADLGAPGVRVGVVARSCEVYVTSMSSCGPQCTVTASSAAGRVTGRTLPMAGGSVRAPAAAAAGATSRPS
jgi:RimJ/RimL family protein N-acetyltransferase